jgi:outer membrane protein OmpA-like peptidoglycan-associated protein
MNYLFIFHKNIPAKLRFVVVIIFCILISFCRSKTTNNKKQSGVISKENVENVDSSFNTEEVYTSFDSTFFYSSTETYETGSFYTESSSVSIVSSSGINDNVYTNKSDDIKIIKRDIRPVRILHNVNTSNSDYHPGISPDGKTLYFTGMDRSGYFDNKIDFTKTKNAGGEDVFVSVFSNGVWQDAQSLKLVNTNGHEAITQSLPNGDILVSGNYPENMGPDNNDNGSNTSDLFIARKNKNYQLYHFDEPVNSIFTELDGYLAKNEKYIIFSSDRPHPQTKYHKKGWLWNDSYWGNTDIYVSLKEGDGWSAPIRLGNGINTDFAERTPWLSFDELTLFVSSNGYKTNRKDMNIYFFTRTNKNDWNKWDGPYEVSGLNGATDDWGYQEDIFGNGFFARAVKLGYTPTKKAKDGTGFVFETNFRSGYKIYGLQSGSFQKDEQTDIYTVNRDNVAITLPDILFDVDSYKLNKGFYDLQESILDCIKINNPGKIRIVGHTDSDGSDSHNQTLSLNRAIALKSFFEEYLSDKVIITEGKGSSKPIASNADKSGKQKNRRVEIYFE